MTDDEKRELAEYIVRFAGSGVAYLTVARVLGDHLTSERVELTDAEFETTVREVMELIRNAEVTLTLPSWTHVRPA